MAAIGPTSAQHDVGPASAQNKPLPSTCHTQHQMSIVKYTCDSYTKIYTSNINPNLFDIEVTSHLYQIRARYISDILENKVP